MATNTAHEMTIAGRKCRLDQHRRPRVFHDCWIHDTDDYATNAYIWDGIMRLFV
jgi:hypothetical protein